jgi:hypothetical protein
MPSQVKSICSVTRPAASSRSLAIRRPSGSYRYRHLVPSGVVTSVSLSSAFQV